VEFLAEFDENFAGNPFPTDFVKDLASELIPLGIIVS